MKTAIKVIAFDADDTLWDCQGHFDSVMQELYTLLEPWVSRDRAAQELFATERKNMPLCGFGTKAFTLSMLETAMRVSHYELSARQLSALQQRCYTLLELPATPLPGVAETLETLQRQGRHMVAFTKGELLDQENKMMRSGLGHFFEHVEIVSNKGEAEFLALCHKLGVRPDELLMVGNSLKSDIAPALAIGAWAVYIPFEITWELEHQDDFSHPKLIKIGRFGEIIRIISYLCSG